jgi:hypothetical protein
VNKFFLNISLALLVFHIAMILIFALFINGLMVYDKPVYTKFDLLFNDNSKQDILLLGSSRTYYGINPLLLETLTRKKVVNAGLEGARINEIELALKGYLSCHPKPNKIFLMLDPHSFGIDTQLIYNKIYFAHYFCNDSLYKGIHDIVGYKATLWNWIPYSLISEFDDYTRLKCLKGNFVVNKNNLSAFNYKGFSLLNRKFVASMSDFDISEIDISKSEHFLYSILSVCKTNNIEVQIIQGPYFKSYYEKNKINDFYNVIAKNVSSKFPEVKVQTSSLNYDKVDYFKDETHLNDMGSTKFTLDLFTTFISTK